MRTLVRPIVLVVAAALSLAARADAAVTLLSDDEVVIQAHEVIEDDLVVQAPYVRVDGVVKGDLTVLAADVVVEGIVEQDLVVVAKTLYLNGSVNDDARVVAFAVALGEKARVADDFWTAGYSLETKPGSGIGGSLYAATRQLLLAGQIVEDVRARSGALELQGLVGGSVHAVVGGLEGMTHSTLVVDIDLEIPPVADGITLTGSAAIGGELDYRSPEPAAISPDASVAGAVRHEAWRTGPTAVGVPTLDDEGWFEGSSNADLERLVLLLIGGLLLALAVPGFVCGRGDDVRERPVDLLGWGVAAIAFTLLASMLLGFAFLVLLALGLATGLGGLALTAIFAGALGQAALFACFLIALVYVAPVLASAGLGRALVARFLPALTASAAAPTGPGARAAVVPALLAMAVGAAAYAGLRAIPWLGPLVGLAGALVGLGALAAGLRPRPQPAAASARNTSNGS